MGEFIGRFHPVLVHLPIGILLAACLVLLLSFKQSCRAFKSVIPLLLWLGTLSAVFSCITGYLLAGGGNYDVKLVNLHQCMGIAVAICSALLLAVVHYVKSAVVQVAFSAGLVVLITITGHLGGSLTHGSDYLKAALKQSGASKQAIPTIANIQEAFIYKDAIQPLLQSRCYSCHGAEKQKGKLRLDLEEFILKGGENGLAVVPGKAEESELIKRVVLPITDKDHMAPKEKPQLTANEIELLKWWINNGATFDEKFKALPQMDQIKTVFAQLESGEVAQPAENQVSLKEIGAADEKSIAQLSRAGVTVVPVAQNSNFLSVNFVNAVSFADSVNKMIKLVDKNLLWVKMDHKGVTDLTLVALKKAENVTRLSLNGASITDKGLANLSEIEALQSLNLVGTKITVRGLSQLAKLKRLKNLYLYQTQIKAGDVASLKRIFPNAKLDMGNYQVNTLSQDTTEVK